MKRKDENNLGMPPFMGMKHYGGRLKRAVAAAILAGILAAGIYRGGMDAYRVNAEEETAATERNVPLPEQKIGEDWAKASGEALEMGYSYRAMENARLAFYINEDGNIGVFDKVSREWYTSVPTEEAREADEIAKAINKMNLGSDYQMVFVDQNGTTTTKNTLTGAVKDENVRLEGTDQGCKVWYYVEDTDVCFSVLYELTDDGFTVTIPFEDIKERIQEGRTAQDRSVVSYWGIKDISVLPYFGAAGLSDQGYMLIPDGSGALIEFNNQKSSYGSYSQEIYGRDPVLLLDKNLKTAENVLMPVFGASFTDHGFFAVAEKGGASGVINAAGAGTLTSYNNVYMTFRYRQSMSAVRAVSNSYGGNGTYGGTGSLGSTVVVDNQYSEGCYRMRYYLLDADSSGYVGMAQCYRNYLISQGMEKKNSAEEAPLYLTLYGGIEDTEYFLGVPYQAVKKLTSYKEAQEILTKLEAQGIDKLVVRYKGWQKDGLEASVPTSVKFEKSLGREREYEALMEYASEKGIRVFPEVDFLNLYKSGAYSIRSDVIQAATHDTAYQYTYDLNTGNKQKENRWQLLTPKKSYEAFTRLMDQSERLHTGNICLGAIGSTLYSDFTARDSAIQRNDAMTLWEEMVCRASEEFQCVMVETGNIYAAMNADYIMDVTSESTGFNLADESVPFYQIVMHGYVSYGSEPINLAADPHRALLKALETGSCPGFSLIYGDAHDLTDTRYNYLYNANYEGWVQTMAEYYAEVEPVLSAVAASEITGHERVGEKVYRTDYGAAGSVYVNYGKTDAAVDGITVCAGSFVYIENERR